MELFPSVAIPDAAGLVVAAFLAAVLAFWTYDRITGENSDPSWYTGRNTFLVRFSGISLVLLVVVAIAWLARPVLMGIPALALPLAGVLAYWGYSEWMEGKS